MLSVLKKELRPVFDVNTVSAPSVHLRGFSTNPTPSSNPPKLKPKPNFQVWDGTVDWNHAKLTFRKFLRSAAEMSTLYNLLDCKLYGSPGRPSFVE